MRRILDDLGSPMRMGSYTQDAARGHPCRSRFIGDPRPWDGARQQAAGQDQHELLQAKAEREAEQAGGYREQREFEQQRDEDLAAPRAEAAQQRDLAGLAPREALRRERDRHARQQCRQQRGQAQEALAPLERAAQVLLRLLDRRDARAIGQPRLRPRGEAADGILVAGEQQAVARAAADAEQATRVRVVDVHQHARREAGEPPSTLHPVFLAAYAAEERIENVTVKIAQNLSNSGAWVRQEAARLLHEILGNPFRPVQVDPAWLAWRDGAAVKVAKSIYEERKFRDLPVLADALEEAGCGQEELLGHCRQVGGHVRGCWAVDLILGRG